MNADREAMAWLEDLPERHRTFVEQLLDRPNAARLLAGYARALLRKFEAGDELGALKLIAARAWSMAPSDPEVNELTRWALTAGAPTWHFDLLRDERRNAAYRAAIENAVQPGDTVFEIGAGSGLLALMAARAGAGHVYSCEESAVMAGLAQAVVRDNGLEDRITIIPKASFELVPGEDLPTEIDVFVAELVDNRLLGEQLLPVMQDAHERLLGPDTIILPARVTLVGVPVRDVGLGARFEVGTVDGFDLSAMGAMAPRVVPPGTRLDGLENIALGPPRDLLTLDLADRSTAGGLPPEGRALVPCAIETAGDLAGILTWLRMDFGDGVILDNTPPATSAWTPLLHRLPVARSVAAGDDLAVEVVHDLTRVEIRVPAAGEEPGS